MFSAAPERAKVEKAMERFQTETCIKFIPLKTRAYKTFIEISNNKKGCFAMIGYHPQKNGQGLPVNYQIPECTTHQVQLYGKFKEILFWKQPYSEQWVVVVCCRDFIATADWWWQNILWAIQKDDGLYLVVPSWASVNHRAPWGLARSSRVEKL